MRAPSPTVSTWTRLIAHATVLLLGAPGLAGCTVDFTAQDDGCGNGRIDSGEACDDGNAIQGDGCDGSCLVEPGWQCFGQPSTCSTICGDGVTSGLETCDGTDLGGQTCDDLGFAGGQLACQSGCDDFDTMGCTGGFCGDGMVSAGEVCDGTNLAGHTCQSFDFYSGTLACAADCADFDASGCSSCAAGWADCQSATPGCETELGTMENCAGCGDACDQNEVCDGLSCRCGSTGPNCAGTESDFCCGTTCTNLASDDNNCGGCGIICVASACNNNLVNQASGISCDSACASGGGSYNPGLCDGAGMCSESVACGCANIGMDGPPTDNRYYYKTGPTTCGYGDGSCSTVMTDQSYSCGGGQMMFTRCNCAP